MPDAYLCRCVACLCPTLTKSKGYTCDDCSGGHHRGDPRDQHRGPQASPNYRYFGKFGVCFYCRRKLLIAAMRQHPVKAGYFICEPCEPKAKAS